MKTIWIGSFLCLMAFAVAIYIAIRGRDGKFSIKLPPYVYTSRFWYIMCLLMIPFLAFHCVRNTLYTDYVYCLEPWVKFIADNGGWRAIALPFSNYSPPYLYFLALVSYLPFEPLLWIRLISIFFSVLGGWYLGKIVYLAYRQEWIVPCVLFLSQVFPTVWINGAYWGQCDSIYTSFMLISLYCLLTKRGAWSFVWLGVAFSFKLQTVFILPLYGILLFRGDLKWSHLWLFFAACFIMWLPSWLTGTPLEELATVYMGQTAEREELYIDLPNMWLLISEFFPALATGTPTAAAVPVLVAIALCTLIFYWISRRDKMGYNAILTLAFVITAAVPLFLPAMHERYIYLGDLLAIAFMLRNPKLWLPAATVQAVSLYSYLGWLDTIVHMDAFPAWLDVAVAILYLADVVFLCWWASKRLRASRQAKASNKSDIPA